MIRAARFNLDPFRAGWSAGGMLLCASAVLAAQAPPGPTVPDGIGVNIHSTQPDSGELAMLAGTGFKWVRMDLYWSWVEHHPGEYDFARYDSLTARLEHRGLKALFILDYANRLYDDGDAPTSDSARAAFARFARAAVSRYAGRGYLWEIWNEPNGEFWHPEPSAGDYVRLASEVLDSLERAVPDERVIGPGASGFDWRFLEACAAAGLFSRWWGVSVHPYREGGPETVLPDVATLRSLIRKYADPGREPRVVVSEWGYVSTGERSEAEQARLLSRELLSLLEAEVPVAIWYDWRAGWEAPDGEEDPYGLVHEQHAPGSGFPVEPKPAWYAARALMDLLGGFRFAERVPTPWPDVFLLRFAKGRESRYAAWTGDGSLRWIGLRTRTSRLTQFDLNGAYKRTLEPRGRRYRVLLDGEPIFLVPVPGSPASRPH